MALETLPNLGLDIALQGHAGPEYWNKLLDVLRSIDSTLGTVVKDVAWFGAFGPAESADTNRTTLQAALDAAEAEGGGTVVLPAGVSEVDQVFLPHGVSLDGRGRSTLRHANPDMAASRNIVSTKTYDTTGTTLVGNLDVTVASAAGLRVGCAIRIAGAADDAPEKDLYTYVVAISGTTVRIAHPPAVAVTDATIEWGPLGSQVRGVVFDGAKSSQSGNASAPGGLMCVTSAFVIVENCRFVNTDNVGAAFVEGCFGCEVRGCYFIDCGAPGANRGFAVQFFASQHCKVANNHILGRWHVGVLVDDRSTASAPQDGACSDIVIVGNTFHKSEGGSSVARRAVDIEGSRRVHVIGNAIDGNNVVNDGIFVTTGQGAEDTFDIVITGNMIRNVLQRGITLEPLTGELFGCVVEGNVIDNPGSYGVAIEDGDAHDNTVLSNHARSPGNVSFPPGEQQPVRSGSQPTENVIAGNTSDGDPRFYALTGLRVDVVATANLPAADATQKGRFVIEDAGGGTYRLAWYGGGSARFRVAGTTF